MNVEAPTRDRPRGTWLGARLATIGILCLVVVGGVMVTGATASTGSLVQKAGQAGCISETGAGPCVDGRGLEYTAGITVSPDGRNAYVASQTSDAVAVFDRAADGTLTQKPGEAGCISETGAGPCADGRALVGASVVTVSGDGRSVYVASFTSDAVAVFDRAADGALTQKPGTAGCVSETGAPSCADGTALDGAFELTVSPDGENVYVASFLSDAVAVFDRAADGTLTQKPGAAGCISDTGAGPCVDGTALDGAAAVTVSPDGVSTYVGATDSDAVAVFDRAADGGLTQKPGTAGCISDTGASPCVDGAALDSPSSVAVSPDGRAAYVASPNSGAVAVFDRAGDGTLTQKPGGAGCISDTGASPCVDGAALGAAAAVAVSPDGQTAYVASAESDAVAVFDRAADGGLTQKPGREGCISETGTAPCSDGVALDFARGVAASSDGLSVYVTSANSSAVAVFDREPPARTPPPSPSPPPTPPAPPPPPTPPQITDVRQAPSLGAGRPVVLTAEVLGVFTRLEWDLRGDSTPEIVSGPGQTSLRFRPKALTSKVAVRAVGPGGASPPVSQTVTRSPSLGGTVAARVEGLIAARPIDAAGPISVLLGKAPIKRFVCRIKTRVSTDILDMEGCLQPINSLDNIPDPERGILEQQARELKIDLRAGAVNTATAESDPYVSWTPVTINGVTLTPRGDAAIVVYPQVRAIASSNAELSVGALKLAAPSRFILKTTPQNGQIPIGSFPLDRRSVAKALGAFSVFGDVRIDAVPDIGPGFGPTPKGARITATLALPPWISLGGSRRTAQVTLRATTSEGLILDSMRIGPLDVNLGAIAVRQFQIDYNGAADEWRGTGKACLFTGPCLDMTPPNGSVVIRNGQLSSAGASIQFTPPPPGVPLFPGLVMERIGFRVGLDPTRLFGNAKVVAMNLYEIDGRLFLAFPSAATPFVMSGDEVGPGFPPGEYGLTRTRPTVGISADASLRVPAIGAIRLGGAYLLYEYPGYVAFGGGVDLSYIIVSIRGGVTGELNVTDGRFNLMGRTQACLIGVICRGATGLVSSRGVAACLDVGPVSIGGGVIYSPFKIRLWPLDGCKWSPFAERNVRGSTEKAAEAQAAEPLDVVVERGDPSRAIQLEGASEAPRVRVTGPGGQTLESPAASGLAVNGALRIIRSEETRLTAVGLQDPRPGTYRIEPLPGSTAVTAVAEAQDPPNAKVSARVSGSGAIRVLSYDIGRRPAQSVTFTEVVGQSRRPIGTVNGGGHGTVRFSPAPGGGLRTIEAQFELAGLPAERMVVARFSPPSPRLGRPGRPQIVRVGTTLRVRWGSVAGAISYEVVATTTGAGQRITRTRGPAATIRQIPRSSAGRVTVRAVAALRQGDPASAAFRATARRTTRFGPLPRAPRLR